MFDGVVLDNELWPIYDFSNSDPVELEGAPNISSDKVSAFAAWYLQGLSLYFCSERPFSKRALSVLVSIQYSQQVSL